MEDGQRREGVMLRRSTRLSLAIVLAAMLSGCSQLSGGGPLVSLEDGTGLNCTPADAEGRAMIGFSHVANESGRSLSIVGAELIDAQGLELIGFELRQPDDPDAHMVGASYDDFGPGAFSGPIAVGAGEELVVVVGLSNLGDELGSAKGVELTYQAAGGSGTRTMQTAYALEVAPAGEVC